jgi:hypothetical protein
VPGALQGDVGRLLTDCACCGSRNFCLARFFEHRRRSVNASLFGREVDNVIDMRAARRDNDQDQNPFHVSSALNLVEHVALAFVALT